MWIIRSSKLGKKCGAKKCRRLRNRRIVSLVSAAAKNCFCQALERKKRWRRNFTVVNLKYGVSATVKDECRRKFRRLEYDIVWCSSCKWILFFWFQTTALSISLLKQHLEIGDLLLSCDVDVNLPDDQGRTLLMKNVNVDFSEKQLKLVEHLIHHHKADVSITDIDGWSAVCISYVLV